MFFCENSFTTLNKSDDMRVLLKSRDQIKLKEIYLIDHEHTHTQKKIK